MSSFPNIYVFTDAGKPVYVRTDNENEEENSRTCSFLSSLRSLFVHGRLGLGDIQHIRSGSMSISFMTVQSLTLVATVNVKEHGMTETVAYLRLVLEYIYSQLLIMLTDQALLLVNENPSYDLRYLIGNSDLAFDLFRQDDPFVHSASFLTGGVQPFFPLNPAVRDAVSMVLAGLNDKDSQDYVFAVILTDRKLVTLVQPSHGQHQIKNFELHLFVSFIYRQPNLLSDDLWLPFCFPRFNASGFLYCYTNCLDAQTKTVLVLVTQDPSLFHKARTDVATRVRPRLGLPAYSNESVLEIFKGEGTSLMTRERGVVDVEWRRTSIENGVVVDEDDGDEDYEFISHQHDENSAALLSEIQSVVACTKAEKFVSVIMEGLRIKHFVFRLDVPAATLDSHRGGEITQFVTSETKHANIRVKEELWNKYRKLCLRLRLGSATPESILDACDFLVKGTTGTDQAVLNTGSEYHAMGLIEAAPSLQGICYLNDDKLTHLAMNGQGNDVFELYFTVERSSVSSIKDASATGAKLARRLIVDRQRLFHCRPLHWLFTT